MSDSSRKISRRRLVRGMGATLALPWLEAMGPVLNRVEAATRRTTGLARAPVRLGVLFMPNGVNSGLWTPKGEGRDFELSPTLAALRGLEDRLLIPTNLWNRASRGGDGHYVKTSGFLTSTTIRKTLGHELNAGGVSMDQIAARVSRRETPIPSLELGVVPVGTGVDRNVGYTRVYGSHIAWQTPTRPLAREIYPHLVFERLFRAGRGNVDRSKKTRRLLDRVLADARSLQRRLGADDRRRVDQYLEAVRSIEERLERSEDTRAPWAPRARIDPQAKPSEKRPDVHQERVRLMLDMMALAFQSDATRVSSFMFGNSVSNESFSFLDGVKGGHHSISHHENKESKLEQYAKINRWHVEQYAYLLRRLAELPEGEGSVLDNSMILFGSGLRDGNGHNHHNLPLVVGGRAGGRLLTGQHHVSRPDTPLANLWVALLDAFGAPVERFADSTAKLPGILRQAREF